MKQTVLEKCLKKELKDKDGATLLNIHPKSFSRLKARYLEHGVAVLLPKKPGPKRGHTAKNRTSEAVEQVVVKLAQDFPNLGPVGLTDRLFDQTGISLNQSTLWRILKRTKTRYTTEYRRWTKDTPQLYCLETPGKELQMDACYPYGRSRDLVEFDAIDDCSRFVFAKVYPKENDDCAIEFVQELIKRAPFRIQSLRVDNRYGERFKQYCQSIGLAVIYNDPYSPEQNGKIERFHKTVKREFYWKYVNFNDPTDLIQIKLSSWINYYNFQRRHGGYMMNRLTPVQKLALTMVYSSFRDQVYSQKVTGTVRQYKC